MNTDREAVELKGLCVELLFDCPRERGELVDGRRKTVDREGEDRRTECASHVPDGRRGYEEQRAADRCPFRMVRELDVVERVKWLKSLGMEELRGLVAYHGECGKAGCEQGAGSAEREGERLSG